MLRSVKNTLQTESTPYQRVLRIFWWSQWWLSFSEQDTDWAM